MLSAVKGKAASGTFTLTAVGGPVGGYAIQVPSGVAGKVKVSPSYGQLNSGAKAVITVTVNSLVALTTNLTVLPGDLVITVQFSIKA